MRNGLDRFAVLASRPRRTLKIEIMAIARIRAPFAESNLSSSGFEFWMLCRSRVHLEPSAL